jgi:hypothetical protein
LIDSNCHFLVLLHPRLAGVLPAAVFFLTDRPDNYHLLLS